MQAFNSMLASILAGVVACGLNGCARTKPDTATAMSQPSVRTPQPSTTALDPEPLASPVEARPASAEQPAVDFAAQVRPILETRCQPCHFPGGVMYERRPFDRPETIHALGEKLFTRIKDEKEQAVIREFLSQGNGH
jgi:hypothetical protein